jgi:hypothetical protein
MNGQGGETLTEDRITVADVVAAARRKNAPPTFITLYTRAQNK